MNYAQILLELSRSAPAPTGGVALYVRGGFVGGRWPRPPSLAMKPQFTLSEADELRSDFARAIAVGARSYM
ncbi:hypothetical protein C0068_14510 [Zhongshania marina]|uniref:Uncharacterized protein n=1 Tax=Zhongshania marina TaxID=2304603 RepID=A0A2S4HE11_9GAMM|nr:hypothetical protein C0068_14510 [Marortus luteolus]